MLYFCIFRYDPKFQPYISDREKNFCFNNQFKAMHVNIQGFGTKNIIIIIYIHFNAI